ncbi:MAG: hypothetical protein V4524_03265 [Patescibacteria group bacterium]
MNTNTNKTRDLIDLCGPIVTGFFEKKHLNGFLKGKSVSQCIANYEKNNTKTESAVIRFLIASVLGAILTATVWYDLCFHTGYIKWVNDTTHGFIATISFPVLLLGSGLLVAGIAGWSTRSQIRKLRPAQDNYEKVFEEFELFIKSLNPFESHQKESFMLGRFMEVAIVLATTVVQSEGQFLVMRQDLRYTVGDLIAKGASLESERKKFSDFWQVLEDYDLSISPKKKIFDEAKNRIKDANRPKLPS